VIQKKTSSSQIGGIIPMSKAVEMCNFEHQRRLKIRGKLSGLIEQSVFFPFANIENWIQEVNAKYSETPVAGIRIYFAGYPDDYTNSDLEMNAIEDFRNRSTVILRAMCIEDKSDKNRLIKIPFNEEDAGTAKDILTFNLGGLCPPRCQEAEVPID